jgi:CheY-like chemotaxis protein
MGGMGGMGGMGVALIVDDDTDIRALVRMALEEEGWEIAEAADGCAGLQHLRADVRPLVVLLDYRMPVLDGLDVLRAVVDDPWLTMRHRYLLLTANAATLPTELQALARQLSVPIVAKPFDLDDLLAAMSQAGSAGTAAAGRVANIPPAAVGWEFAHLAAS